MGITGVTLYDSDCEDIADDNPLPVKIQQNDPPNDNLKTTLYDENGNVVDTLSQVELLECIIEQLKINNLHLALITDMVIKREDI